VFSVEPFNMGLSDEWNDFVRRSRNGTFLFERGYMDYHADRFQDDSLLFRDRDGAVAGLLPASRSGSRVSSHGGLTYGGLVLGLKARTSGVIDLLDAAVAYYRASGVTSIEYKCVPRIYHRLVSEDVLYALFRLGATLVRRDVSSTVQPAERPSSQARRLRGARKARAAGISVRESAEFDAFWPVLESNLSGRHGVRPVHTADEITLLARRFPKAIRLFMALDGTEVVAGTIIYETPLVAHAQYIGSNRRGRDVAALDLLFEELIDTVYPNKQYFDFGISTEADGRDLDAGLIQYKEGFGATATVHDFYHLDRVPPEGMPCGS
jgi:hypothetical protein